MQIHSCHPCIVGTKSLDDSVYFFSLSLNLLFNFPKNPLARFDFLSVDALVVEAPVTVLGFGEVATLEAAGSGEEAALGDTTEVSGALLEPTPVVMTGWDCPVVIG